MSSEREAKDIQQRDDQKHKHTLTKEDILKGIHMRKYATLLVTGEMQLEPQ
jgi:hypothetical protein